MCDCYTDKCKVCGVEIKMHLGDYSTNRNEVEVFCEGCLPAKHDDGIMWKYRDSKQDKWKKMFVRALTANAVSNASENHPNVVDIKVVWVPDGTLEVIDEMRLPGKDGKPVAKSTRKPGQRNCHGKGCKKRA